jgi:hypothetical protein
VSAAAAGRLIAIGGLLFIAALTLRPDPHAVLLVAETPFTCLLCGSLGLMDVLLNILLFVPYGLGLRLSGLSRLRTMLIVMATTGAIELTQGLFLPGRDASLSDLLTNTAGGALGLLLAERWRLLLAPSPVVARRLAALAGIAWLLVQAVTAWSLAPSLPATEWWGQRTPELGQFDRFTGRLITAHVAGESLPSTRLPNSAALRRALLEGPVTVEATVEAGSPTARVAPIASIFDQHQHEVLILGQEGRDLIFRLRLRASDLRLRSPAVRLPDALPAVPGDPVTLRAERGAQMVLLQSSHGGSHSSLAFALTPSLGWSLLMPWENYAWGPETKLLTALWLAGLLLPFGYWLRLGWGRAPQAWWLAALCAATIVALGLGVVAWLSGLVVPPPGEWGAAALGIMAGTLLAGPAVAQASLASPPSARSASLP